MHAKFDHNFNPVPAPPEPYPAYKKAWKTYDKAPWTIYRDPSEHLIIVDTRAENRMAIILPPEMVKNLLAFLDVEQENADLSM